MDEQHLIPMANRIAEFFATQPRANEQLEGVVEHLCLFWAPQMRQDLVAYIEQLIKQQPFTEDSPPATRAAQPRNAAQERQPSDQKAIAAPEVHPLVLQAVQQARERLLAQRHA